MSSKLYDWLPTTGGVWSIAANWNDVTDGIDPSPVAPGPADTVILDGPYGGQQQTVTGPGSAAAMSMLGDTLLAGSFAIGALTIGGIGQTALISLPAGSSLTGTSAAVVTGSLLASGTATMLLSGTLSVGDSQAGVGVIAARLSLTAGAQLQTAALSMQGGNAQILIDGQSSLEVGRTGAAAAGELTVDAGALLSGWGQADAYGSLADAGTIEASGGTLLIGATSGAGTLAIAAGGTLLLEGIAGAGLSVQFLAANASLGFVAEYMAPTGPISGFGVGDTIDFVGSPITSASYTATGQGIGVLTAFYGTAVAATFTLLGSYAGDLFLPSSDGAGGTVISVAPGGSGGGGPPAGTPTPDLYHWASPVSGAWSSAAAWIDDTQNQNPAALAPGVNDLVTIAGAATQFTVVSGDANAASLAVDGEVAFLGTISVTGALTVGPDSAATLDLLPGVVLRAGSAAIVDGAVEVTGPTTLAVAGTLSLAGGPGSPDALIQAASGARVTAAAAVLAGATDTLTTDSTASIEIGAAGGAAAGAVTIDAGAMLSGAGSVNPFGTVIDNGTIEAIGGTLVVGAVAGTGSLLIGAGAALDLHAACSIGPAFSGGAGTLLIGSEQTLPSAAILDFGLGDVIDLIGGALSAATYGHAGSGIGTLTLYDGTAVAGTLLLAGSYNNETFLTQPDGAGGTDIVLISNGGTGGGGGNGSDPLTWATPGVSGYWSKPADWLDLATGQIAGTAPGASNAVTLTGQSGIFFMTVSGPGSAAALQMIGNSALSGTFTIGTLTVGTTTQAADLDLPGASVLTAALATVVDGELLASGAAASLSVSGTLTLGGGPPGVGLPSALLSVQAGARAQFGGLVMGGGAGATVSADAQSSIEIGTLGGAVAGRVTVDPGCTIAGNGALEAQGAIEDNGTIEAAGGTLAVGVAGGSGVLSIGGEAALLLEQGATAAIDFTGAGGALEIQGTALPTGPIEGFTSGDLIDLLALDVTALTYMPGSPGTLTLSYDGTPEGSLLLSGDFSGDTFQVVPDGAGGSAITVITPGGVGGPPPGTPGPDLYVWTGAVGFDWASAGNWSDLTTGANPAALAPGSQNLVTLQGPAANGFTSIVGPADAASLTILGQVALVGTYAVGMLAVGAAGIGGYLAVGSGSTMQAQGAEAAGVIAVGGAGAIVAVGGTLALGGTQAGVLSLTGGGTLTAASLVLTGSGDAVVTDNASAVEIGGAGGVPGAVTVDFGALIQGAGSINPFGQVVDDGTILASGGTLALGQVSGAGTLVIAPAAELALDAVASTAAIDFSGPGTLGIAAALPTAPIGGFGAGDAILLPDPNVTQALYAQTGAGIGVLTLFDGSTRAGTLTLLGIAAGTMFTVVADAGGGTSLTPDTGQTGTGGGGGMSGSGNPVYGGQTESPSAFLASEPTAVKLWMGPAVNNQTVYQYTADSLADFGPPNPFDYDVAVFAPPGGDEESSLPPGYQSLLIQGNQPTAINDGGASDIILVGAAGGNDTISSGGQTDTVIAGQGGASLLQVTGSSTVIGGGNDTIETGIGNAYVSTSQYRSLVFLGPAFNTVYANGTDTIVGASGDTQTGGNSGGTSYDTIYAGGAPVLAFAPQQGELSFVGGAGAYTVCGAATSNLAVTGGTGAGLVFGSDLVNNVNGGTGAIVFCAAGGATDIQGGPGAMTVFGGTGNLFANGANGNEVYVVGTASSTLNLATGNQAFLVGAGDCSVRSTGAGAVIAGIWNSGNDVLQAGGGNDSLWGGIGSDTLMAGTGNALMVAGTGSDIFGFTDGLAGGSDTIFGFTQGRDLIQLNGYPGGAAAALAGSTVAFGNTLLTLADGTHVLVFGVTDLSLGSFT